MQFEYAQYVSGCLVLPISVSLFMLPILVFAVLHLTTGIIHREISSRDVAGFLLAVLVCGFFLCMNVGRLLHGGIHLIYERESDAVEFQGNILEINELGRYSFPELESEYGHGDKNGIQILIDGVECTAIARGELAVGDNVTISYLPRSRYVLSITANNAG